MTPPRKTALTAEAFYVLSFISIPTLALYVGSPRRLTHRPTR